MEKLKLIKSFINSQKLFIVIAAIAVLLISGFAYFEFFKSPTLKVQLPQGFPSIPIYPKSTLIMATSDPHEGETYYGVRYGASWTTKDEVSKVAAWYTDKLKSVGWNMDSVPANPLANDTQLVTLSDKDYSLNMSFTKNENTKETTITAEFSRNYASGEPMITK